MHGFSLIVNRLFVEKLCLSFIVRKKLLLIAIAILLLTISIHFSLITYDLSLARAQTPLEQAKKDYVARTSEFSQAKNSYISAKSSYAKFQTATAKAEAFSKTQAYLAASDNFLLSYLALIREYSNETRWQSSDFDKNSAEKLIAEQVSFLENHKQDVQSAKTLEELPPLAASLKNQITKVTQPKISKLIVSLDIAQTQSVFADFKDVSGKLNQFVTLRITPQNQTFLVNWQSEINDIREKTETNLASSLASYQKITTDYLNQYRINESLTILGKAKAELKRSKALFAEMTKII